MILNVRGTSGSGKSTLAREVMTLYGGTRLHFKEEGRKRPLGYVLRAPERRPLAVIGSYESSCGGCDTINCYDRCFALARQSHGTGCDVLMEGLLLSEETQRTIRVHQDGIPIVVLHLTVDIEECIASVKARRLADGNEKPLNEANTRRRVAVIERAVAKLEAAGLTVFRGNRDYCAGVAQEVLGL